MTERFLVRRAQALVAALTDGKVATGDAKFEVQRETWKNNLDSAKRLGQWRPK